MIEFMSVIFGPHEIILAQCLLTVRIAAALCDYICDIRQRYFCVIEG